MDRGTPLWKIWWVYGAPVACAAGLLLYFAEELRLAYKPGWADFLDTARLAGFWLWCWPTWNCARNVAWRGWTAVTRLTLAAGLVAMVAF